jgi:hypothetical protein
LYRYDAATDFIEHTIEPVLALANQEMHLANHEMQLQQEQQQRQQEQQQRQQEQQRQEQHGQRGGELIEEALKGNPWPRG